MSVPTWYVLRSKRTGRAQVTAFCECLLQYDAYYVRSTISAIPEHPNPILYLLARPDGIVLYRKTIPPEALPATQKKKKKTYCSSGRAPWRVCAVSTRVAQRAKSTVQCHWQARDTRLAALLVAPFRASTSPLFHQTGYSCRAFRGRLSWAINQLRKQASRPPARFFDLGRPKSPTESAARAEQKIKKRSARSSHRLP